MGANKKARTCSFFCVPHLFTNRVHRFYSTVLLPYILSCEICLKLSVMIGYSVLALVYFITGKARNRDAFCSTLGDKSMPPAFAEYKCSPCPPPIDVPLRMLFVDEKRVGIC